MPARIPGIQHWRMPYSSSTSGKQRGRWLMFGDTRRSSAFIDLHVWPPQPIVIDNEYVVTFDILPDGRMVVCSMLTDPVTEYAIRVHPHGWPNDRSVGPAQAIPLPVPDGIYDVVTIGDRVVVYDWLIDQKKAPETHLVYVLENGRFVPAVGLPPVQSFDSGYFSHQTHANGKVVLEPGRDVLIWDGNGYELEDGVFGPRWELAAAGGGLGSWTSALWGSGFFYRSNGKVMYARWLEDPVPVLPDADNVMYLAPGPDNSICITHGQNRKSLIGRVWYPEDGSYIPIRRTDLGYGPSALSSAMNWSDKTERIYFGLTTTIPVSALSGLKRTRPRGDGYRVRKA